MFEQCCTAKHQDKSVMRPNEGGNCDVDCPRLDSVCCGGEIDEEDDPERLLDVWLGELDSLASGLNTSISPSKPVEDGPVKTPPLPTDIAGQRMDSYRFSMANLEDTQDVDLDAVLGELCALESQYQSTTSLMESEKIMDANSMNRMLSNSNQTGPVVRTDSPDNDSAFSDCVSLLSSSESSASSGTTNHSVNKENSKAEKIRLALQKMKEASVKKLFIKVFNDDGGAKSLLVDEGMRCSYVMRLLAEKHHINLGPRWGLVEHLPDLHMERVYEEHELLVDNLMLWTRDSKNRLLFVERPERTQIFENPSLFNSSEQQKSPIHVNANFAQEYFCNGGLPSIEGPLYIKTDSRKGWKKYYSVLRASGLYYYKDKVSRLPKDLICLSTFDVNQVYYGVGWKKKYKAPTEFCFAIKHPCLQQPKSTKYIKYVCAEDEATLQRWMSAIRIVKYGQQLLDNYESALTENHSIMRNTDIEDIESGLSDSGSSGCDVAFESDYPPCGTIKRKPPKLPLTATTRQLTCSLDTAASPSSPANHHRSSLTSALSNTSTNSGSSNKTIQKPVKTVKFADRTPSLESLPPPPPELLVDDEDEPNDQEIMSVPPPPPKLLSPPSTAFLADLHRVVCKKWQVAQKCKSDTMTTPHEVLGFRDPNGGQQYSREANVSNWVAEHYGPNNLYENIYPKNSPSVNYVPVSNNANQLKKRPPPPPPPRSEKTQLSRVAL
ncbi:amyloid beta A4 precursor protein-binding family B member 1-interacting protein isoform X2 [Daktulosphaira vitifoliae]|uniref:amyloid beta A4 precursor protein-binding family B member 1-interacting protein isoform X2 n=2 Tax=Daktulosphaira vitifoliae TaxID=58002 RepID=UPI0021AA4568|nr:amyloid beta A4 precursor protein-binding family B member 1-interacting protein isoform X2 [Daktulosphaira vitifoliae]